MPNYNFDKAEVLRRLEGNRDNHRQIFEEALEGYRKFALKEFEKNIKAVKNGKLVHYVSLQLPVDHTKDYDRIIEMLNLSSDTIIPLTEDQFAHYMQDDWEWKRQFLTTNSYYSSTAAKQLGDDGEEY